MIKYCNKLNPANNDNNTVVNQKDKNTIIEEALQQNDWKEAKGQYILSRKEKEDDFFAGKGKKKQPKKPTTKPQEETGAQPLNHQIETLNYFEEIKVAPPLFTDKLAETLKVLGEKKAYFEKLSNEAIQTDEERKNLPEDERKRLEEEDKQKRTVEHVRLYLLMNLLNIFNSNLRKKKKELNNLSSILKANKTSLRCKKP